MQDWNVYLRNPLGRQVLQGRPASSEYFLIALITALLTAA